MSGDAEKGKKRFFSGFTDAAVFLGWIAGLFLAGFLLWSLTQSVRDRSFLRTVNRVLIQRGEMRRLRAPLPPSGQRRGSGLPGTWYSLADSADSADSDGAVFVFSVMGEGIMTPYAAFLGPGGKVDEIVPLSVHAEQFMPRFRKGLMEIFIHRIEAETVTGGKT
ncbi:MAG: hypothetical protein LBK08_08895 [Treponema sp.]|nr:hypothetical protein [Treponema sp.]